MNLLLLPADTPPEHSVVVKDRARIHHIRTILKKAPGDSLVCGIAGHDRCIGTLDVVSETEITLHLSAFSAPPPPVKTDLILALPRPKTWKKVLFSAISFGLKTIHVVNSARTDKSYWTSEWITPEKVNEIAVLALEQSGDTALPEVTFHPRFRPFAEDRLPDIMREKTGFLCDPSGETPLPSKSLRHMHTVLAIGPEGGWVPFECECFARAGFANVHLNARILRTEDAVSAALGKHLI